MRAELPLFVVLVAVFHLPLAIPSIADPGAPGGTFVDDDGSTHEGAIEALVGEGVTAGCDAIGPRYCPTENVSRAQMATLLARALELDLDAPDRFDDDDGSFHEASINAVASAGITIGCSTGVDRFCPDDSVSRAQMAAFLVRAFDLAEATDPDRFSDDDGLALEPEIDALAASGITVGCATNRYCPTDAVGRDQMATFIGRALGLEPIVPPARPSPLERIATDHDALTGFGERVAGTDAEETAFNWLEETLTDLVGWAGREEVPLANGRTSNNVWASVGSGTTVILLGAHVDSVSGSIGSDDNGSGVAVLLDVFRHAIAHPPPGTTVIVAFFGAEERLEGFSSDTHHAGSRAMSARLVSAGDLPDRMFSIDMIGIGDQLLAVRLDGYSATAADELIAAAVAVGIDVRPAAHGEISDHEPFAKAGVLSAFLWRPDNPAWHTPNDTTVDLDLLVEDRAVLVELLDRYGR